MAVPVMATEPFRRQRVYYNRYDERIAPGLRNAEKENPAVGAPGQTLFVIGVYGFKYAARLLACLDQKRRRFLMLLLQPSFSSSCSVSCSSGEVRNLTEAFADSPRFSVACVLNTSLPEVGTNKQDLCHGI
jgi:hypothetical protein